MKTIEEEKKEVRIFHANSSLNILGVSDSAFKKGVEFVQRWIPVEEELPEEDCQVLVKWRNIRGDDKYCVNSYWNAENSWQYNFEGMEITHWRPIEYK